MSFDGSDRNYFLQTLACPAGSTSHYQLLYLIDQLKLRDVVTVRTAQPSELELLWRTGVIDGAFVWSPHLGRLRAAFKTRTLVTGAAVAQLGAPTFIAYIRLSMNALFGNQRSPFT